MVWSAKTQYIIAQTIALSALIQQRHSQSSVQQGLFKHIYTLKRSGDNGATFHSQNRTGSLVQSMCLLTLHLDQTQRACVSMKYPVIGSRNHCNSRRFPVSIISFLSFHFIHTQRELDYVCRIPASSTDRVHIHSIKTQHI